MNLRVARWVARWVARVAQPGDLVRLVTPLRPGCQCGSAASSDRQAMAKTTGLKAAINGVDHSKGVDQLQAATIPISCCFGSLRRVPASAIS